MKSSAPRATIIGMGKGGKMDVSSGGTRFYGTTSKSLPQSAAEKGSIREYDESKITIGLSLRSLSEPQLVAAVAGGTYSLPVELPDGQVQLDFARPGGAAELSITATPENIGKNLWSSAIAIIVATLVSIIALLIAKRIRKVRGVRAAVK